jgi:hypothetical protein
MCTLLCEAMPKIMQINYIDDNDDNDKGENDGENDED